MARRGARASGGSSVAERTNTERGVAARHGRRYAAGAGDLAVGGGVARRGAAVAATTSATRGHAAERIGAAAAAAAAAISCYLVR